MKDAFNHFEQPLNAAVIGASGGIGKALASALQQHPNVASVSAYSRKPAELAQGVACLPLDLLDENTIAKASETIQQPLDLIIVASGVLHSPEHTPEKSLRQLDPQWAAHCMAVNATGPMLVAKHFLPRMRKHSHGVFAALSARVGSIGDNQLGGWYSYRASKAALNMYLATLAIEQQRQHPKRVICALHPGTVDTALSEPFQSRVPEQKLFSKERAARQLLQVIGQLSSADSGKQLDWQGKTVIP